MSLLAVRYAKALVDVLSDAKHSANEAAVVAELNGFAAAYAGNAELRQAFGSPAVPRATKRTLVSKLAPEFGLSVVAQNFLTLITRHDRMSQISEIMTAVTEEMDSRGGILRAVVTAVMPMGEQEAKNLEAELARVMGKPVRCTYAVDGKLLGGVTVRIGSKVYDGSIRGQLDGLKRQLGGRAA